MLEKNIEKEFLKYKKNYIKKYGRIALDNFQINKECEKLFGKKYNGCWLQDESFPIKNGFYILNTDIRNNVGKHWVGVYLTDLSCSLYDSFGRNIHKLLSVFLKRITKRKIFFDKKDREQKDHEIICGHLSLSWVRCVHRFGIKKAIKI